MISENRCPLFRIVLQARSWGLGKASRRMRASGGPCPRPSTGPSELIPDGVLRALTWKPARFSTSY